MNFRGALVISLGILLIAMGFTNSYGNVWRLLMGKAPTPAKVAMGK